MYVYVGAVSVVGVCRPRAHETGGKPCSPGRAEASAEKNVQELA